MDDIISIIEQRRSIRRFDSSYIEDEKLRAVLEAGRWSPSWANSQCWEIVVVRVLEQKAALSKLLSLKNPATRAVENAPVVLAICAEAKKSGFYKGEPSTTRGDWLLYDLGLLTQTICLTAHSLGLGTVIVGAFDHIQAKALLQIPDGYEVAVLVPMGYPAHEPPTPKRKEVSDFTHYDRFGNKKM